MTKFVQCQLRAAVSDSNLLEGFGDEIRVEFFSVRFPEYIITVIVPAVAIKCPVLFLLSFHGAQQFFRIGKEFAFPVSCRCFRLVILDFFIHACYRAGNMDCLAVKIDHTPFQAQYLAAAEAIVDDDISHWKQLGVHFLDQHQVIDDFFLAEENKRFGERFVRPFSADLFNSDPIDVYQPINDGIAHGVL